jgi:hypothetical protein
LSYRNNNGTNEATDFGWYPQERFKSVEATCQQAYSASHRARLA